MKKFIAVFAFTASVAYGQRGKCDDITCASSLTKEKIDKKNCECRCQYDWGVSCPEGTERASGGCACIDLVCNGKTCDEKWNPDMWTLNEASCECVP